MDADTVNEDQYYRCFICETDQNSVEEFELHLQCLEHLSNLLSRHMIAAEHYELLIQLNNFSLLKDSPPLENSLSSVLSSSAPSSGIFMDDDSPTKEKVASTKGTFVPRSTETLKVNMDLSRNTKDCGMNLKVNDVSPKLLLENGPRAGPSQPPKPIVGNFYCNLCSVSIPDCNAAVLHEKGAKHQKNKDSYSLKSFPIFKCNICGLGLSTGQKAADHFQSSHGAKQSHSNSQGSSGKKKRSPMTVLVCQPCGKMGASVGNMKQHFSSDAHKKALKDCDGKTSGFLQCRPCKSYFNSLAELTEHEKRAEHITALRNW